MSRRQTKTDPKRKGFTLIELVIVVAIIGLLASLVIPAFGHAIDDAEVTVFIKDLRTYTEAAGVYMAKTNDYLPAAAPGTVPPGWAEYIEIDKWTSPTPIGGAWDIEFNTYGIISGIGVDFAARGEDRTDAYMRRIDRTLDDGNLATGRFRKVAQGRFYFVLEELVVLEED